MGIFRKMQPTAKWLEQGTERVNGKNVGFYEFVSTAIDTNMYNLYFLCCIRRKGSFMQF